ncbi:MAG: uroporphyrinogen decarboxylase family protein [Verrucomicrobiota bacterium]|nr:uroporphyrinogen decarboxylase family protein [Verrucomicrobiota bacterium]
MKTLPTTLTSRERVILAMEHKETDHIPRMDSFWPETIENWKSQGMPADMGWDELYRYLDFDMWGAGWMEMSAYQGRREVIRETDEWVSYLDGQGAVVRYWKSKAGTPEHESFTVKDRETWEIHKKALLATPVEKRISKEEVFSKMKICKDQDLWFYWNGVECFEIAKDIFGHEQLCVLMAEDPELVSDVFETLTDIVLRTYDYIEKEGAKFDGAWIYGDIAYNHGPFCSPSMYRKMVQPSHKRHVGWFKERQGKVIYHTDGDFRPLIPAMLENGFDCFQPMESKANIDIRELKPKYGEKIAFMGNIDIMVLISNDREKYEAEVAAKIPMAKKGGGYIYHSDHSIPPQVTWENYLYLMELVKKYGSF